MVCIFVLDPRPSQHDFTHSDFEKWDGDLDALNDNEIDALLNFELKGADCDLETDGRPFANSGNAVVDPPNEDDEWSDQVDSVVSESEPNHESEVSCFALALPLPLPAGDGPDRCPGSLPPCI